MNNSFDFSRFRRIQIIIIVAVLFVLAMSVTPTSATTDQTTLDGMRRVEMMAINELNYS